MRTHAFAISLSIASLTALGAGCGDNSHEAQLTGLQDTIDDLEGQLGLLEDELAKVKAERDDLAGKLGAIEGRLGPAVTLEMPLVYGQSPLALATPYPVPGSSDTIAFREVRYWLTNVALRRPSGELVAVPDGYYLIEARQEQPLANGTAADLTLPAARRETISLRGVQPGTYTAIQFHIGVDPEHNDDLSNTAGELHTLQNMTFDNGWMWFTSYIFTRTRADLTGPDGAAITSWDNGSNADYRAVTLAFPSALAMKSGSSYTIRASADLEALVGDVSPRQRLVINAGTPADRTLLADSFRDMFSMVSATANP